MHGNKSRFLLAFITYEYIRTYVPEDVDRHARAKVSERDLVARLRVRLGAKVSVEDGRVSHNALKVPHDLQVEGVVTLHGEHLFPGTSVLPVRGKNLRITRIKSIPIKK